MKLIHANHLFRALSVSNVMLKVLLAMLPAIAVSVWQQGSGLLLQLLLATVTALAAEAAVLKLRARPIRPALADLSAVLTGWLIALALPPLGAWWLVVVATAFAIIVGKQLYGGLGNNPFNPAMLGFALVILSFPAQMAQWGNPQLMLEPLAQWQWILWRELPAGLMPDAISSATPLDLARMASAGGQAFSDTGWLAQAWPQALAWLACGLYLLQQRVISWHAPAGLIAGVLACASLLYLLAPELRMNPLQHLLYGATAMAAFFIVTDPVSGAASPRGRLIFGVAAGVLTVLIRSFGNFPDGVAFAVLLMNLCVPLLDQYTRPTVFGHRGGRR